MGSQSSFDHVLNHLLIMCMLNINFKILGEILVSQLHGGVNHLLTMCMLNINCQNSR